MDFPGQRPNNHPLNLNILNMPPSDSLIILRKLSLGQDLVRYSKKKKTLVVYQTQIPKSKLYSNLEIYEWRNQTEFPIVKPYFLEIKNQQASKPPQIDLEIFIELTPLKLKETSDLTIGQSMFFLKEAIVGFERLFNRFGAFQVFEDMIAVNQKGFCKVWINENYSLNACQKRGGAEDKMVRKIISLIENHTLKSKSSKKLFSILRESDSFLKSLKLIEGFSTCYRILVPMRFISIGSLNIPKSFPQEKNKSCEDGKIVRFSVKTNKPNLKKVKSQENLLMNLSTPKKHSHNLEVPRFKSEEKINILKASDGETAYSRNLIQAKRSSNFGSIVCSPKNVKDEFQTPNKFKRWMEESSFILGSDENEKQSTNKKELTHSEAFQIDHSINLQSNDRKYSINFLNNKKSFEFSPKKLNKIKQAQETDNYLTEFTSILNDDNMKESSNKIDEQDEDSTMREHFHNVLKNNGWNTNFSDLMKTSKQLKESIHAGKQENFVSKNLKLQKLASIGRREVSMSILPEQYEQLF